VVSTVRYGKQVWSPVSSRADVVIATETLEGRRALDLLADKGTLIYATTVIAPGSVLRGERPYPGDLVEAARARQIQLIAVDAEALAREAGTVRAANVALLGAATHVLPFGSRAWERALELAVPAKILELNRRAFALGRESAAPTEEGL
jgi:indolepyruvate ferredoxin oxidoreductase beta subunit